MEMEVLATAGSLLSSVDSSTKGHFLLRSHAFYILLN